MAKTGNVYYHKSMLTCLFSTRGATVISMRSWGPTRRLLTMRLEPVLPFGPLMRKRFLLSETSTAGTGEVTPSGQGESQGSGRALSLVLIKESSINTISNPDIMNTGSRKRIPLPSIMNCHQKPLPLCGISNTHGVTRDG